MPENQNKDLIITRLRAHLGFHSKDWQLSLTELIEKSDVAASQEQLVKTLMLLTGLRNRQDNSINNLRSNLQIYEGRRFKRRRINRKQAYLNLKDRLERDDVNFKVLREVLTVNAVELGLEEPKHRFDDLQQCSRVFNHQAKSLQKIYSGLVKICLGDKTGLMVLICLADATFVKLLEQKDILALQKVVGKKAFASVTRLMLNKLIKQLGLDAELQLESKAESALRNLIRSQLLAVKVALARYPTNQLKSFLLSGQVHTRQAAVRELNVKCRDYLTRLQKLPTAQLQRFHLEVARELYVAMRSSRTILGYISSDQRSLSNLLRGPLATLVDIPEQEVYKLAVLNLKNIDDDDDLDEQTKEATETVIGNVLAEDFPTVEEITLLLDAYLNKLGMIGELDHTAQLLQKFCKKKAKSGFSILSSLDEKYLSVLLEHQFKRSVENFKVNCPVLKLCIKLQSKLFLRGKDFYAVAKPMLINVRSILLDEVEDVAINKLFITSSMHFFDIDELVSHIAANKIFTNPITKQDLGNADLKALLSYPEAAEIVTNVLQKISIQGTGITAATVIALRDLADGLLERQEISYVEVDEECEEQKVAEVFIEYLDTLHPEERQALNAYTILGYENDANGIEFEKVFSDLYHNQTCMHDSAKMIWKLVYDLKSDLQSQHENVNDCWREGEFAAYNAENELKIEVIKAAF